jgi:hypothetical protein
MKDKTSVVLAVGAAAFAIAVISRFLLTGNLTRETFMQQDIGAPINQVQEGAYNGIDISNGNSWSQSTAPTPLKAYEAANDNELFAFQNSTFKPECCPNTYSNSMGCACMSGGQYNYLIMRGGNNVPYSEY